MDPTLSIINQCVRALVARSLVATSVVTISYRKLDYCWKTFSICQKQNNKLVDIINSQLVLIEILRQKFWDARKLAQVCLATLRSCRSNEFKVVDRTPQCILTCLNFLASLNLA